MDVGQSVDRSVPDMTGVCVARLNHGPVNALPLSAWNDVKKTVSEISDDPAIRVAVLHGGEGRFCAGADITELAHPPADTDPAAMLLAVDEARAAIGEARIPVIAAIDGPAHGGGLELALACDIRIASEQATFAASGVNMGLIASVPSLVAAVGDTVARRMLLTGERIDATTAQRWGLITDLADSPLDRALAIAHTIAAKPPLAIEAAKAALRDLPTQSREIQRSSLTDTFRHLAASEDHREAIDAFLNKRPPTFTRE